MNIADLLNRETQNSGVALIDRSQSPPQLYSMADLQNKVRTLANGLLNFGLKPQDRVGLLAGNCVQYYEIMFGAPSAGLVFVPINTRLPAETLQYIVDDANLKLLIVDEEHASDLPTNVKQIVIGSPDWRLLTSAEPQIESRAVTPNQIAIQIYTSGSTGRPKGVLLSHQNITFTVLNFGATLPGEVMLVSAPLYHKNASMSSKLAFASGGTVVLLPKFDALDYLDAIETHGVTMCSGVPTMYALVTAEIERADKIFNLSTVQRVFIGSAPLTEALFDDVQKLFPSAFITNGYGTTEAVLEFGPHPQDLPRPKISLGYQHQEVELKLIDPETGEPGDNGELLVRSPGVMTGYHDLPEINEEKLTDGWYHTGDLMRRDQDGWFFFIGRVDDMFVCAGENIYPDAVEQMLEKHPLIHQAVVVSVSDDLKGELPVAFLRLEDGHSLSVEEVKTYALTHGPAYAHPRQVWFLDEIPLASTAKVDRNFLSIQASELLTRKK